jgi:hypothetical protein
MNYPRPHDISCEEAARAFPVLAGAGAVEILPLAGGIVNRSHVCRRPDGARFVLQRINPAVFPDPGGLMDNLRRVCAHLEAARASGGPGLAAPVPYPARGGGFLHRDRRGRAWRLLRFIPGRAGTRPSTPEQAGRLGAGLGLFHRLLAGFDHRSLCATVPGFHRLSFYLDEYDRLPRSGGEGADEAALRRLVDRHRDRAQALERAWLAGALTVQAIHGDPKAENFILGRDGGVAALVDLDTVMGGPPVLDLADCVRSCAFAGGSFSPRVYHALAGGWRRAAGPAVHPRDAAFLPTAVACILFELGLRFFTDHLRGDRYFQVSFPGENLLRAREQFAGLERFRQWAADNG